MSVNTRAEDRKPDGAGANAALFKALSHPLRYRIMMVLGEREASPKELAELLDEDFHRVYEQVRILNKSEFIELVGTDSRHGGTQHFYRASVRPVLDAEAWEKFPRLAREIATVSSARRIFADVIASIEAGVFDDRKHRALLRRPIVVDEQGFKEADESALRHLDELTEIEARSASRLIESGAEGINVATATLVFEAGTPERRTTAESDDR
jgi:DNA-binding transcriptional ArsR family regulator